MIQISSWWNSQMNNCIVHPKWCIFVAVCQLILFYPLKIRAAKPIYIFNIIVIGAPPFTVKLHTSYKIYSTFIDLFSFRPSFFQWSANSRLRWLATLSLYILSYTLVILTAPLSFFFVLVKIPEYERAVVLGSTIDLVRDETCRFIIKRISKFWFSNL